MKEFQIEHQWQLYLQRAEVKEEQLSFVQKQEMRRAFFGAWGQLLILMREELSTYSDKHGDDKGADVLQDMLNQVANFWISEKNKNN